MNKRIATKQIKAYLTPELFDSLLTKSDRTDVQRIANLIIRHGKQTDSNSTLKWWTFGKYGVGTNGTDTFILRLSDRKSYKCKRVDFGAMVFW